MKHGRHWFSKTGLWLGLGFLYLPILSMIVFSFNNSRLVTVWDGPNSPTLKWYGELFRNEQILGAAWLSIRIAFSMAYVTIVVQSRLAGIDKSHEDAALDLGARPAKVFFRITLPLIVPAIMSGWLLAFTLSWDDVVVSQFVAGPGSTTLPMVIFSKVRLGVSPDVNALATIMVLIVATGVVASSIWMRRQERRRDREMQMAAAANK